MEFLLVMIAVITGGGAIWLLVAYERVVKLTGFGGYFLYLILIVLCFSAVSRLSVPQ